MLYIRCLSCKTISLMSKMYYTFCFYLKTSWVTGVTMHKKNVNSSYEVVIQFKYRSRFQLYSISVFLGMLAKLQKATISFMQNYGSAKEATHGNIKLHMCITWLISKATNTHSEYAIVTASPRQQWLYHHASTLCLNVHGLSCLFLLLLAKIKSKSNILKLNSTISWCLLV